MKKKRLRSFVLPTLYLMTTISIFIGIIFFGRSMTLKDVEYDYGTDVIEEMVESVIVEDTAVSSSIVSPVEESIEVSVHFYNRDEEETRQQASLIYYENTYLPNTGLLYTSDESFEVKSVFAGKVTQILDDEFFGKCVVVEHNPNLRTYYYGLEDIEVSVGDEITTEGVLGISKNNVLYSNKKSFLLEVYYNNELINPETFIGTKVTDYE